MGAPTGSGRHAVITGASGFIGSNLTASLVADGWEVTGLDIEWPEPERRIEGCHYVQADLSSEDGLRTLARLIETETVVYHLAADMGGVGYFHKHDYYPFINNARMTMNALQAAEWAGAHRFVYAASACAYPTEVQRFEGEAPKLAEQMLETGTPDQMYGREKLMGIRLCERAPFDARVGVFHTIYGPRQERTGERMKFPTAVATKALAARETGVLELWGNGNQLRSYLYVDDAIIKIRTLAESDVYAGPVNIGKEGAVTCREIAETCLDIVGATAQIVTNEAEPSGVLARDCSNAKWRNTYGGDVTRSDRAGFQGLIDWLVKL